MKTKEEVRLEEEMTNYKMSEKMYNEMSKEDLVKLLLFRDMFDLHLEPSDESVTLWCFVSDETGGKYLTDEKPQLLFIGDKSATNGLYLTEGEVNIRIPKCLESLFPDLKYGEDPVKVNLTISY